MLYVFVVIDVALQRSISDNTLPQQNRIDNRLSVDRIADCRDNIFILSPVFISEIEKNPAIIRGFHLITGVFRYAGKGLSVTRRQQRKIQFS